MRWLVFLVVFLIAGALFIISNGNLHLGNPEELQIFKSTFYGWLGQLGGNVKSLTAYVVNVDWMP